MKIQKINVVFMCLILCFFSLVSDVLAQEYSSNPLSKEERTIYFGEGIPSDVFYNMKLENLSIEVMNSEGSLLANLNELTFTSFLFNIPGDYTIYLKSNETGNVNHKECNHEDHERTVDLHVMPYHISFLFDEMTFSSELIGGKNMSGNTLQIPVDVKLYNASNLLISGFKFQTAGINTTLEGAIPNEQINLNPGTNLISYQLQGSATKNTYIMFDFFDMNGRVHSFGYNTQIK